MNTQLEVDCGEDIVELVEMPGSALLTTDEAVARMTRPQREARLERLIENAHAIYDETIKTFVTDDNRKIAGEVGLFSGGNDSTTLVHILRDRLTHLGHANTTIGLEVTRQYVRDTATLLDIPLLERRPPRFKDQYRAVVLDKSWSKAKPGKPAKPLGGFPGPAKHNIMWQKLKERALEEIRRELVSDPYKERVVFVAGRRRAESQRRASIPENGRKGSTVWLSPLINWTKLDLNTYRTVQARKGDPVPVNPVTVNIHMSGECLCGAYCAPGEREQLEWFYPESDAVALIRELEAELLKPEYDHIPIWRKTWGWVAIPELKAMADADEVRPNSSGLCVTCDTKYASIFDDLDEEIL